MKAKDIGNLGEDIAVKFILEKGYEIVERNFLKPFGEIDIIAKDKDFLVFIEVKARKNINFGFPREFVNGSKIKKIQDVAQIYMMEKNLFGAKIRFDVIEIIFDNHKITHIELQSKDNKKRGFSYDFNLKLSYGDKVEPRFPNNTETVDIRNIYNILQN